MEHLYFWEGSENKTCIHADHLFFQPECHHSPKPHDTEDLKTFKAEAWMAGFGGLCSGSQ